MTIMMMMDDDEDDDDGDDDDDHDDVAWYVRSETKEKTSDNRSVVSVSCIEAFGCIALVYRDSED